MALEADITEQGALIRVDPAHGLPVTFAVEVRRVDVTRSHSSWAPRRYAKRFVVCLANGRGDGFSTHSTVEAAVASALRRARSYERAYSQPRGLAAS